MQRLVLRFLVLSLLLLLPLTAFAQQPAQTVEPGADEPIDPNANISWPPPVYVVRDEFAIRGSANLPDMVAYFVEFRALAEDLSVPDEAAPWFPAVLPSVRPVQGGVLGVWNTTIVPDGLYELRLVINRRSGEPFRFRLSPVRVENNPPPFVQPQPPVQPPVQPAPLPLPTAIPQPTVPPPPTATPTPDPTPRFTAGPVNANVRAGDSTDYQIIGSLASGETARILGRSNTGSGWFLIQLPDGRTGWIAPFVGTAAGNLAGLQFFQPPPPPATATPTPTATPATAANIAITNVVLDPDPPSCNQTFNVRVTVTNNGTQATSASGAMSLQDAHVASGTPVESTVGGFPVLNPGQSFEVVMPITVSAFFNEEHRLTIVADSANVIPETNEADNTITRNYILQQAAC